MYILNYFIRFQYQYKKKRINGIKYEKQTIKEFLIHNFKAKFPFKRYDSLESTMSVIVEVHIIVSTTNSN